MKLLRAWIVFFALLRGADAYAQQTELFAAIHTGSPFSLFDNGEPPVFLNFSVGAEQYIMDRIGMSLSFRKPFYLINGESNLEVKERYDSYGYSYLYTEQYNSYAIDIESKFFFESADDGGVYMSSSLSFQHLTMKVSMLSVNQVYSPTPASNYLAVPGDFKDEVNIYPFTVKFGHRTSTDALVFDYSFGIAVNFGVGGIERLNEQYLDYYRLKTISIPIGLKMGLKF